MSHFVRPASVSLLVLTLFAGCADWRAGGAAAPHATPERKDIPDGKPIITRDPPTTPLRTLTAGGTNVRVNQDSSGRDQNETTIAVNPANSLVLVGGANDARPGHWAAGYYSSLDGGATWVDGVMPFQKYPNQGDPTVAFCGDGTAVFGYLDFTGAYQPHRLIVSRSTDGGRTWLPPGTVYEGTVPFADKPYIACAPAGGTAANRVYISWTNISANAPIRVAFSSDFGQTWRSATNISVGAGVQGSCPVAGAGGLAYVFWLGPTGIEYSKSTNGGLNWAAWKTAASATPISNDTTYRRNSFPAAALDTSAGAYAGYVYVVWADGRNGDPDIYFTRSGDGGANWAAPLRVNQDPLSNGRDQFFPWIAVDDTGLVHVMWLDKRADPANAKYQVYVATSRDGGLSFDENIQVSDAASNGALSGFLGDYSGLAARAGKIYPLWSDLRAGTGEEDIYIEVAPAFAYDNVSGVAFGRDRQTLYFDDQAPRLGTGITYDVLRGDVGDFATGDAWSRAVCAVNDQAAPPAVVTDRPDPGHATYYLIRAQGPRGVGSYGAGTGHPNPRSAFDDHSACN